MQPSKILVDGIDRLGKSTLIQNILHHYGYHLVIHYDKPKLLNCYVRECPTALNALNKYQDETNKNMFNLMTSTVPIIFDRTHLGEMVYAPMYRKYPGDYVFNYERHAIERKMFTHQDDFKLILLTTSNFDIVTDDGLSFDFSKKEVEQSLFIEAFNKSSIVDKRIIDVHDGKGGYKDPIDILTEVMIKKS